MPRPRASSLRCLLASAALAGAVGCVTPVVDRPDAGAVPDDGGAGSPDAQPPMPADAAAPPLRVTSASRVLGTLEQPIELALAAEGGTPPYGWSLSPASLLPVGFSFSSDGVLRGTPHASGHFPFGVFVADTADRTASATLEVFVAEPVFNDLCAAALPLDLSAGAATVLATLDGAKADGAAAACRLDPGLPDVYYAFELSSSSKVTAAASQGSVAVFDQGCASLASPLGCGPAFEALLAPGSYLVAVTGNAAGFRLDVKATPLLGDSCADVISLDLSGGQAVVTGDFKDAKADIATCGYSGADRVYSFELSADSDLRVRDTGANYTVKSVRAGACPGTSDLGCNDGYGELSLLNVKAGKYVLVLKSVFSSADAFSVTLTASAPTLPPANDTCAGATPLTFVHDSTTMSGTLLGATYDAVASSCGGASGDVYFTVDLPSLSTLTLDATYGSDLRAEVFSGACGQLVPLGCSDSWNDPYCKADLPSGKYYLRVTSSYSSGSKTFSYTVTRKDPPAAPANDTCAAATALAFKAGVATASGELASAPLDYALPCAGSTSWKAHDVVYGFTLANRSDVQLTTVTTDSTSLALGLVAQDCETGDFLGCTFDPSYRPLQSWGLEPGDYWVVVQGANNYSSNSCWAGKFSLNAKVTASPTAPPNDTCDSPTAYTFAGPGAATLISGTTRGASDGFGKVSCPYSPSVLDGPDVVYALALDASARLRVSASTAVDGMFFYLSSSCGSTAPIACSPQSYSTQEFLTSALPAGTYYLVVDSSSSYGGTSPIDFSLVVDTL